MAAEATGTLCERATELDADDAPDSKLTLLAWLWRLVYDARLRLPLCAQLELRVCFGPFHTPCRSFPRPSVSGPPAPAPAPAPPPAPAPLRIVPMSDAELEARPLRVRERPPRSRACDDAGDLSAAKPPEPPFDE